MLSFVYLHKGQPVDKPRFFAARFARLYPLYFVVLLIGTPRMLLIELSRNGLVSGLAKAGRTFTANMLLLQGWDPPRLNRILIPSWSLSGEVFFYLCFPLLGVWLWKLRGKGMAGEHRIASLSRRLLAF